CVSLPFTSISGSCRFATPAKQKSPLSASGLKSLAAVAYNVAPRTKMCGLLNRYPNQKVEILTAVVLDVLIIYWRFRTRASVFRLPPNDNRILSGGFYRADFIS